MPLAAAHACRGCPDLTTATLSTRSAAPLAASILVALALSLGGCASRAPLRDGAGGHPPADIDRIPDAEPKIEPFRVGGPNKPYDVMGRHYVPVTEDLPLRESGGASWYGRKFQGRPTASGEPYDMYAMTAAHRTMPIPSYARVSNPANGREVIVRINDRGPFAPGRVIDLSYTAAHKLGVLGGVAPVEVQRLTFADIRARERGEGQQLAAALPPDDPAPGEGAAVMAQTIAAPGFWLQLGAFRARAGADELQQRVLDDSQRGAALPAVAVFEDDGWFRVQAGPWADRDLAEVAASRLRRQLGLAPFVLQRVAAAPKREPTAHP
jgi:peptidoglycan lytic transglycosylase